MGLLAAALSGGSKEYLKQSDEKRVDNRQKIRDERLQEFQLGQISHRSELATNEAVRAEGVAAEQGLLTREHETETAKANREHQKEIEKNKPITLSEGQDAFDREGNRIASGRDRTFAPSAAGVEQLKTIYRMGPDGAKGAATTHEELLDEYLNDPDIFEDVTTTDELGNQIKTKRRKPGSPGLTDYKNQKLHGESRITTDAMPELVRDPDRMWDFAQRQPEFNQPGGRERAIESIKKLHDWWQPEGGVLSRGETGEEAASLDDSGDDIQAQIDRLKAKPQTPETQQAIQQYQGLLSRAQGQ